MKLDELRTVQSKERRKDSLQQLRDSFYEDVAAYIQDLKASRDRRAEQVDNPFSDNEVRRLSDELETAEEVAEAIYERRVGKVVKLASFAAADMPVDDEGMTSEERRLFDDLVARIEQNKNTVLDVLSGNGASNETAESSAAETSARETATEEPTPPPSPTERVAEAEVETEAEAEQSTDGMLADAMGSTADSADVGETTTGSESTAQAAESTASPAADTPPANEVPPVDADPEPDAVLGTQPDGAATDDVAPNETPAAAAAETVAGGSTQPETDGRGTRSSTDGGTVTESPPAADSSPAATGSTPASTASTDGTTDTETGSEDDTEERTTVRITKNVGDIFGVDGREYTLRSEDVVTLPTANADPLVDRDAAMRLE